MRAVLYAIAPGLDQFVSLPDFFHLTQYSKLLSLLGEFVDANGCTWSEGYRRVDDERRRLGLAPVDYTKNSATLYVHQKVRPASRCVALALFGEVL